MKSRKKKAKNFFKYFLFYLFSLVHHLCKELWHKFQCTPLTIAYEISTWIYQSRIRSQYTTGGTLHSGYGIGNPRSRSAKAVLFALVSLRKTLIHILLPSQRWLNSGTKWFIWFLYGDQLKKKVKLYFQSVSLWLRLTSCRGVG